MVEVDERKKMSLVQWVKLLARYRICGLYILYNGILACHLCHKMFHFRLLTIIPEGVECEAQYRVQCTDGALRDPHFAYKDHAYRTLWPPHEIFTRRHERHVQKAHDGEVEGKSCKYECAECGELFKAPRPLAKHCGRYDCCFMAQGRKAGDYEGFEWVREPDLERLERSRRAVNERKKMQ
jgi:hypothetical protein